MLLGMMKDECGMMKGSFEGYCTPIVLVRLDAEPSKDSNRRIGHGYFIIHHSGLIIHPSVPPVSTVTDSSHRS